MAPNQLEGFFEPEKPLPLDIREEVCGPAPQGGSPNIKVVGVP